MTWGPPFWSSDGVFELEFGAGLSVEVWKWWVGIRGTDSISKSNPRENVGGSISAIFSRKRGMERAF